MKKIRIQKNLKVVGDYVYTIIYIPTETTIFSIGYCPYEKMYQCHNSQHDGIFKKNNFKDPEKAIKYGLKTYSAWCKKVIDGISKEDNFKRTEEEYRPSPMSMYGA